MAGKGGDDDDVPVLTLSGQDPELAARHAAYMARKKQKAKRPNAERGAFLSNVQETEEDVAYRFSFFVIGGQSTVAVEQMCKSRSARCLGGNSNPALGPQSRAYRCLCDVQLPATISQAEGRQTAKLAIQTMEFQELPAQCETRQEALNTAFVYVLCIDSRGSDGAPDFAQQLDDFNRALQRLRESSRARLRPVKAVLLCCQRPEGAAAAGTAKSWTNQLVDFEQANGDIWKFGPICLEDGDALHAAFAEMTSTRIAHARTDTKERCFGAGEDDAAQDDAPGVFRPSAGNAVLRMPSTASSDAGSIVSERERPPRFETEMSGSECSETALELHERAFGGFEDDSPALGTQNPPALNTETAPAVRSQDDAVVDHIVADHIVADDSPHSGQVTAADKESKCDFCAMC